ncbi:MAG: hypothetical protein KY397_03940 [Gemmatimonadetes bacterium]|nr:hypothetical protein [Gemmatimonadota bacterium]
MRALRVACSLVLACGFAAGCSQRVTPEEEYSEADRERPLVDPSRLPPGMADGRGGAPPPSLAEPAADAIRGTISLPEGVEPAGSEGGALFLFVRAADAAGGPPLAVQRHAASAPPLVYAIGSESRMLGDGSLPDRVVVEARLDADGDAMTTDPGDWTARSEPVAPGADGVDLLLSR